MPRIILWLVEVQGEIYCLAAAGGMLFSGGQDQSIRVWKFDPAKNGFECSAVLLAPQGGHGFAVSCLVVSGQYMFSADFGGTIKVGCWGWYSL